jgi:hypothetical protein
MTLDQIRTIEESTKDQLIRCVQSQWKAQKEQRLLDYLRKR